MNDIQRSKYVDILCVFFLFIEKIIIVEWMNEYLVSHQQQLQQEETILKQGKHGNRIS